MSIKVFMISLVATSIIFSLLYIPTTLTIPITTFRPNLILNHYANNTTTPYPVTFAYLISATKGDLGRLKRLLHALYHPGNCYLIHMDYGAPRSEHRDLAEFIREHPVFSQMGNVWIVKKSNLVTYRGPTMLSTTLHAMSVLLRVSKWDWFINLSASDYPLVSQDGMVSAGCLFCVRSFVPFKNKVFIFLYFTVFSFNPTNKGNVVGFWYLVSDLIHAFSELPSKDLNFIQHSSRLGWKLNKRGKPIVIDPGLYSLNKSEIWWAIKQRALPTAFKLYTGSAWTIISRSFAEYCIMGWDNLPRTLLLYYTNVVSSPEGYFQTLICNDRNYKNTTVNHDLHYISWDTPPKQHPRSLGLRDYRKMVLSNRPFARKFKKNDQVLNKIDRELLKRRRGEFSYGGWCSGTRRMRSSCSTLQSDKHGVLKPGPGSRKLRTLLSRLVLSRSFQRQQCR